MLPKLARSNICRYSRPSGVSLEVRVSGSGTGELMGHDLAVQ